MPRATAAELRRRNEWEVELDGGLTVLVRRVDLVKAFMLGMIPLPLLQAMERLQQYSKRIADDPMTIIDVPQQDKEQTIQVLQRYAINAIADPVFVLEDDGDPAHCPVSMLTTDDLMKIWQSGPRIKAEVTPAMADTFRQPAESPVDHPAIPDEPQVPPPSERVSDGNVAADIQYL